MDHTFRFHIHGFQHLEGNQEIQLPADTEVYLHFLRSKCSFVMKCTWRIPFNVSKNKGGAPVQATESAVSNIQL